MATKLRNELKIIEIKDIKTSIDPDKMFFYAFKGNHNYNEVNIVIKFNDISIIDNKGKNISERFPSDYISRIKASPNILAFNHIIKGYVDEENHIFVFDMINMNDYQSIVKGGRSKHTFHRRFKTLKKVMDFLEVLPFVSMADYKICKTLDELISFYIEKVKDHDDELMVYRFDNKFSYRKDNMSFLIKRLKLFR